MIYLIIILVVSYLLGSIPSSVWIGKAFYGIDIREHGSGNAGTTNTFRVLGKKPGIMVFLIDVIKGVIPVLLPLFFINQLPLWGELSLYQVFSGVLAVVGHIFPVFAGFRGGKGVATMLGVGIGVHPIIAAICFGSFITVLIITKYVSVSSMFSGLLFAALHWFAFDSPLPLQIFASVVAVLLVFTHKKNIKRLLAGNENKTYLFGGKKS
jgi:glycerol-3-phosphate acyltransferase PlsY